TLIDDRIVTQNKILLHYQSLIQSSRNDIFKQRLRFKKKGNNSFPKWVDVRIGDLLKVGNGKDYKHLQSGGIPVFGTGGFMTSVDDYLYDGETVCIGRKGTIDKPMYYNGKIW